MDCSIQINEYKRKEQDFNNLDEVHKKLFHARQICDDKDIAFQDYINKTKNQQSLYKEHNAQYEDFSEIENEKITEVKEI